MGSLGIAIPGRSQLKGNLEKMEIKQKRLATFRQGSVRMVHGSLVRKMEKGVSLFPLYILSEGRQFNVQLGQKPGCVPHLLSRNSAD